MNSVTCQTPQPPECYNPAVVDQTSPAPQHVPDAGPTPAPHPEPDDDRRYIRIRRSHFFAALVPLAFAAGLAYGYLLWGRDAAQLSGAQGSYSAEVARIQVDPDDDPALGPLSAPITIVEFADFNCPYCQAWHQQVFRPLMDAYPDQIRFIYRDFPIVGGGAIGLMAAHAANCAAEQEGYWEYHAALYSGRYPLTREGFQAAAEALGLDPTALADCIDSGRYAEEPRDDLRYGSSLGVSGTPTFFINGLPIVGAQPLARFVEVIEAELGN